MRGFEKESLGEVFDEGFDGGEGGGGGGAVEVVNVPEFDAVEPVGKAGGEEGAVFGFLEGDDVVGGLEVGEGEVLAGGSGVVEGDAAFEEALTGLGREVAVNQVDGEAAGKGAPGVVVGTDEVVEAGFGEAAAVVVTGAEEEDVAHAGSITRRRRRAKQKGGDGEGNGRWKMENGESD
jgi:hypothetical protein